MPAAFDTSVSRQNLGGGQQYSWVVEQQVPGELCWYYYSLGLLLAVYRATYQLKSKTGCSPYYDCNYPC